MGIDLEKIFFSHYVIVDQYADDGAYSHSNLVRKSDGETVIVNCLEQGAEKIKCTKKNCAGYSDGYCISFGNCSIKAVSG